MSSIEEWRPVVGLEGKYEISNMGRVKSLNYRSVKGNQKILKPYIEKGRHNYHKYTLVGNNSKIYTLLAHWLVMEAFVGERSNKFIDHIDGNGSNNALSNLRYCTHRENLTFDNVKFNKQRWSNYPGVHYNKNSNGKNKWRAIIQHKRKRISIGTFATELEAAQAYNKKLKEIEND